MIELLTPMGSFALVWLGTWLVCSLMLAAGYPLLRGRLQRLHPADASALLLLLLAFPMLVSLISTVLLFIPGLESGLVTEHCHADCQAHVPLVSQPWVASLGLVSLFALLSLLIARLWFHVNVGQRLMRQLGTLATTREHYALIDDAEPLVFTLGWWRNRIFLTSGLLRQCSEADIAIVLAHERAHVERRDNVRLLLARLFLLVLPRGLAARLFDDLHGYTESACDLAAADQAGHLDVASTLLKVQRLVPRQTTFRNALITSAFTGAEVERRVLALLAYHGEAPAQVHGARIGAVTLLLCSVLLVDPLHHGVELVLQLAGM